MKLQMCGGSFASFPCVSNQEYSSDLLMETVKFAGILCYFFLKVAQILAFSLVNLYCHSWGLMSTIWFCQSSSRNLLSHYIVRRMKYDSIDATINRCLPLRSSTSDE